MEKRLLNDLSVIELGALFDSNEYIKNAVFDMRADDESYYIKNEIISYFEHASGHFSACFDFDSYDRCTVKTTPEKMRGFLSDCLEFASYGIGFGQDFDTTIIERLFERVDIYRDAVTGYIDMSNSRFDCLEKWFDSNLNDIMQALEKVINDISDSIYDYEYAKTFFIEGVKDLGYFDDMTTDDGRRVFFEVCKY